MTQKQSLSQKDSDKYISFARRTVVNISHNDVAVQS